MHADGITVLRVTVWPQYILHQLIAPGIHQAQARSQPIRQRPADITFELTQAVAATIEFRHRLELSRRPFGLHTDNAGGDVFAVQGTLWPLENLDGLHVSQIADANPRARTESVVYKQPRCRFESRNIAGIADIAHTEGGRQRTEVCQHNQRGHLGGDISDIVKTDIVELL